MRPARSTPGLSCLAGFVLLLLAAPAPAQIFQQGPVQMREAAQPAADAHAHEVGTGDLFGLTNGSDMEEAGNLSGGFEIGGDFARRSGRYAALGAKLGVGYGVTDNISAAFNLLGGYRVIRNVPDMPNTSALRFDGIGTELRWRLLERGPSPVGLTLHIEPSLRTAEAATGARGIGGAVENKLIVDAALIPDQLFAAFNLLYNLESFRADGEHETARASALGVTGAVAARLAPHLFLGAEVRYLRAYEGLGLNRFQGDALFVGPTLFWNMTEEISLAAAFGAQVAGHAVGDRRHLDLVDFSRYQAKLKLGFGF